MNQICSRATMEDNGIFIPSCPSSPPSDPSSSSQCKSPSPSPSASPSPAPTKSQLSRNRSLRKKELTGKASKEYMSKQPPLKPSLPEVNDEDPSWSDPILYLTGLQQSLVLTWTAMISPYMLAAVAGGGNEGKAEAIQSSLFTAGINTILQIICGSQLPVMMKTSDAFINSAIFIAISTNNKFSATLPPRQRFKLCMRRIQGASIIGSILQIIIGFSGLGVIFASRIGFVVSIPLISLTGLELYKRGFPQLVKCIEIGLLAAFTLISSTQLASHVWKSEKNIGRRMGVTISIAFAWAAAHIMTLSGIHDNTSQQRQTSCRTYRTGLISAAHWINIQMINPFQWGYPTFEVGDAFLMMAASVVATIESVGSFCASSRHTGEIRVSPPTSDHPKSAQTSFRSEGVESALPIKPSILRNAIGFQGIGTLIDAVFGAGLGSTVSSELAGLLGLTKLGGLKSVFVAAILLLLFSTLGKLAVILASIPMPIVAALYIVFFPYVVTSGLEDIHYCNLNRFRTRFILGFALFMGLSMNQYFDTYDVFSGQPLPNASSSWFKNLMQVIFSSPPTTATIFASLFDLILPRPSVEEGEEKKEDAKEPPKPKMPEKPKETEKPFYGGYGGPYEGRGGYGGYGGYGGTPKVRGMLPIVPAPPEVRETTIPEPQKSLPLPKKEVMEPPLAEDLKSFIDENHSASSAMKKLFSAKHR
ncbi:nucleobase-ascorbate transporter 6 isoform X2 [Manihot esculenta]|nr:nucleobase-ascorbate transporter 6 isoform X2 [Manihot esculenta]